MKPITLLLTSITAAFLSAICAASPTLCPTPGPTVNGTKSISANVLGSTLTISTSNAFAGAITSIIWRGKQFIDAADHGREMQTAVFAQPLADENIPDWVECYNANEAGSVTDTTSSSSKLRSISAVGNVLTSKTQMAFYLPPGATGVCGEHGENTPAHNQCVLSKYILDKTVTIGFAGISNVIEYVARVTIPEELARGEIVLSAYGPRNLGCVKDYDFRAGIFHPGDDVVLCMDTKELSTNYEADYPVALYEGYGGLGMAMYSPELMQPKQDGSHPIRNPFLQWVMFPAPNPTTVFWGRFVQSTPYHTGEIVTRRTYLVVGTVEEMRSALQQLHSYFYNLDPDVFDWQQYLAWNGDVAAAMPGQYNSENHWNWWGLAEGRRAAVPFWAPGYLQRYPDISNYCGPTNYPCAAQHYVNYGRNEGRIGY
jgi:hypothetical protein